MKTKHLTIRVDPDFHHWIKVEAYKRGYPTIKDFVTSAIAAKLSYTDGPSTINSEDEIDV